MRYWKNKNFINNNLYTSYNNKYIIYLPLQTALPLLALPVSLLMTTVSWSIAKKKKTVCTSYYREWFYSYTSYNNRYIIYLPLLTALLFSFVDPEALLTLSWPIAKKKKKNQIVAVTTRSSY